MSNPFDQFDAEPVDYTAFARQEAERAGLSPDLVARVMRKESAGDPSAVSPKGARGLMQLMPGTAAELGVDPDDPHDNIRGGVRYLKQQMDAFGGDERLALAAYNAGPGAVQKYGGVPPYAETQEYVADLAGKADGNPFDQFDEVTEEAADDDGDWEEIAAGGGVSIEVEKPKAKPGIPKKDGGVLSIAGEALGGALEPIADFGQGVIEDYKELAAARAAVPRKFQGGALGEILRDVADTAGGVGDFLNIASAPAMAAARPAATKLLDAIPLKAQSAPQLEFDGLIPRLKPGRELTAAEERSFLEGGIVDALGAARPAKGWSAPAVKSKAPSLEELKQLSDAAWAKVDQSGFRFPAKQARGIATDIRNLVSAEGGADLYPVADALAKRITSAAGQKTGLSVGQLNRLKSQVGEKLMVPGSTEAHLGREILDRLETLIASSGDPNITAARDLYRRLKKVGEVQNRLDSAELAQAGAGTGGNGNATRQKLKPLIDPKSPQRMRNLTEDEAKAMRKVVKGTPAQNAARVLSAFDPLNGRLTALLHAGAAATTGGQSAWTIPLGLAATRAEKMIGQRNLDGLIDLMAAGGSKADLAGVPLLERIPGVVGLLESLQLPDQASAAPHVPRKRLEAR